MATRVVTAICPAKEQRRETLEALEDVDAGRVVHHDEVDAWVAALQAKTDPETAVN